MEREKGMEEGPIDRSLEWFVPKLGSPKFRSLMGLLFLPYTGMVLSFSVLGSVLAHPIHYDRLLAIVVIYFLGLGIGAHVLDALGSRQVKPWGRVLTTSQLWVLAIVSLALAYLIAAYFIVRYVPLLGLVAVVEGFFVFAYNLEWFQGWFHTDRGFAFSWGCLPVLAGYIMQTNRVSVEALALALSMGLFSMIEISASRPYKVLKKTASPSNDEKQLILRYELILKCVSLGVILLGAALLVWRMAL